MNANGTSLYEPTTIIMSLEASLTPHLHVQVNRGALQREL